MIELIDELLTKIESLKKHFLETSRDNTETVVSYQELLDLVNSLAEHNQDNVDNSSILITMLNQANAFHEKLGIIGMIGSPAWNAQTNKIITQCVLMPIKPTEAMLDIMRSIKSYSYNVGAAYADLVHLSSK